MNEFILYLGENYFLIAGVAISTSLLTSLYDWNKSRVKVNKIKVALIRKPNQGSTLSQKDFNTKMDQDKLNRLMKIHGIDEDKAKELQKVIDQEWQNTIAKAQKGIDEANTERLTNLH